MQWPGGTRRQEAPSVAPVIPPSLPRMDLIPHISNRHYQSSLCSLCIIRCEHFTKNTDMGFSLSTLAFHCRLARCQAEACSATVPPKASVPPQSSQTHWQPCSPTCTLSLLPVFVHVCSIRLELCVVQWCFISRKINKALIKAAWITLKFEAHYWLILFELDVYQVPDKLYSVC